MIFISYIILDIIQNQYLSPTHPRPCSGSLEHAKFTEKYIGHGFRFAKHTDHTVNSLRVISHRPAVAKAMAGQAHTDTKDKNLDRIYPVK
jgi:hypothetical protein